MTTLSNDIQVLFVDDDKDVLDAYQHLLSMSGFRSRALSDPTEAAGQLTADWPGVVVLDMYMPKMSGMELLADIKAVDAQIPVIIITGHGHIPMAVEALKCGANEFLEKPIDPPSLLTIIKQKLDRRSRQLEQKTSLCQSIANQFVGPSAQSRQIREHIAKLAMTEKHVTIIGKPGSGRRLTASLIHGYNWPDGESPQAVSGHRIGRHSDIDKLLSHDDNQTVILAQPEAISMEVQQHLSDMMLRQEYSGATTASKRVIALFDTEPEQLISGGKLNPSLYYLFSQGVIELPELRQRPDDIPALFHYFLKQSCKKLARTLPEVDESYLALLRNHAWPGNVRELKNVAELYAIDIIKLAGSARLTQVKANQTPLDELMESYEKQLIEDALHLHGGKVTEAATQLQVPRKKLYLRMKKHGLDKESYKRS